MKNTLTLASLLTLVVLCFTSTQGMAQETLKTVSSEEFKSPPNSAKPRVWWHWMNGNITKAGIKKDLEWMEDTGIGGFQNFDANLLTPVVVSNKLVFMTPGWKEAFKYTTDLAIEKKLEMAIAGSPGWSVTGGPWVEPKDGMKKYVWSELTVKGGQTYRGRIPEPPQTTGVFQNDMAPREDIGGNTLEALPKYYQDVAVIAYRIPDSEKTLDGLKPKVSSSGGDFNLTDLTDGDLRTGTYLPPEEVGEDMWIQYEFETPQTFQSLAVVGANHNQLEQFRGSPENRSLKISNDGINFSEITRIHGSLVPQTTVSFPPTTAKYFRFAYETLAGQVTGLAAMMGGAAEVPKPDGVQVAEFILYNTPRIDKIEDKAGFSPWKEGTTSFMPKDSGVIATEDIIDLTSKMKTDGSLEWKVPNGNWSIIRFGYSLTGRQNHPASPEATGLEVDKLDPMAVKRYINTYLDMYRDATDRQMGDKGLGYMILDSYEAGHMNWTKNLPEEFQKKRGYSIQTWIPALTGRIVKSAEASDKFLWDFRKTIGEMIAENHYDVIGDELHKRGMKRYTESHEGGRIYLADGMDVKRNADIPMSAMWTPGSLAGGNDEEVRSEADIRESASVAHIYGKAFVAAESMTSIGKPFQEHPERLKRTADLEMASGLNRFVIHTSVHQPLETPPGFSLGPFGQYFTRHETWSGAGAKAWITYLGRSSYLLQQGKNVADILYYYGENTNITWVSREKLPEIPQGLEFDYVNASILKEDIKAEAGNLLAPSGNTYKVLMLDKSAKEMTLSTLNKIRELQNAGVKVTGKIPENSPSLSDDLDEFYKLADEVESKMASLESLNLVPDVQISGTDHKILFRHRRDNETDIYWLNNRSDNPATATVSFNVSGKTPNLWNAETGEISPLGYQFKEGRTLVPLDFKSWDAVFVVFQDQTTEQSLSLSRPVKLTERILSGTWTLDIDEKSKELLQLKSWTDSEDTKYFSGTALYTQTFNQKKRIKEGEKYVLQFHRINNIAEVVLNGKNLGAIWKKPYEIDITSALKKGNNELQISVTNTWVNRLIGDAQPDVQEKMTFTTMPFYKKDADLPPSGLIGPIKMVVYAEK